MMLLYMTNVLVGFSVVAQKIIECTQLFGFCGGGDDKVLERYSCCNVAHAKRTLHIKYPNNISNAMLYSLPKRKQIITCLLRFIWFPN